MARSRKPKPLPLEGLQVGDVFAIPLAGGRWGACRVLQFDDISPRVLVAASPWVGETMPDLSEPLLRVVLHRTHHSWNNEACLGWTSSPVPVEFVRVGTLPPTAAEASLAVTAAACEWVSLPYQVYAQWRWDNEREAVLAEDEAERQGHQEAYRRHQHSYKPLPKQTLHELRNRPFEHWEECLEPDDLRASRKIARATIDLLLALGPDAPEPSKMNAFHWCVEQFNELDSGWICTVEREDICDLLGDLADLCGLEEYDDALTGRRDW